MTTPYAPSGISDEDAAAVKKHLQARLISLLDMSLVLKHAHWNVVGQGFIAIHELFDAQVAKVRLMADEVAERIATLGGEPDGRAGTIVKTRTWDDYGLNRGTVEDHLAALDSAYSGIIRDHRKVIDATEDLDVVTQDLLVQQAGALELMQWFIRAHLESTTGTLDRKPRNDK